MLVVFVLHRISSISALKITAIPQSRLRRASSLYTREPFGVHASKPFYHRETALHFDSVFFEQTIYQPFGIPLRVASNGIVQAKYA